MLGHWHLLPLVSRNNCFLSLAKNFKIESDKNRLYGPDFDIEPLK